MAQLKQDSKMICLSPLTIFFFFRQKVPWGISKRGDTSPLYLSLFASTAFCIKFNYPCIIFGSSYDSGNFQIDLLFSTGLAKISHCQIKGHHFHKPSGLISICCASQ